MLESKQRVIQKDLSNLKFLNNKGSQKFFRMRSASENNPFSATEGKSQFVPGLH